MKRNPMPCRSGQDLRRAAGRSGRKTLYPQASFHGDTTIDNADTVIMPDSARHVYTCRAK